MLFLAVTSTEVTVDVEAPTSASGPGTPSQPGEEQAYIVQPGDSLSAIAQQF